MESLSVSGGNEGLNEESRIGAGRGESGEEGFVEELGLELCLEGRGNCRSKHEGECIPGEGIALEQGVEAWWKGRMESEKTGLKEVEDKY